MRSRLPVIGLSIAMTVAVGAASVSAEPLYVADSANHLVTVDVTTGEVVLLSGTLAQFTDIAFGPGDELFGVTSRYLYQIDPLSGWSTLIGNHGFGEPGHAYGIDALTFGPDGTLFGAGNDVLIAINTLTGQGTLLGDLSGYLSAGDIAADNEGRLFLTTDVGVLVEVMPDGSGATAVGNLPYDDIYAFAGNADGELFGVRATNEIVSIDPTTGEATILGEWDADFNIGYPWGGTFPGQFVPEPVTLVMCFAGAWLCLRRRRRAA